MKPTNYAYACSMKLGDNPEQARERYESLKGELIKMGYEEAMEWMGHEISISINYYMNSGRFIAGGVDEETDNHGPFLPTYNRSLFLAIAGQKVGGGVGCWYVGNESKIAYKCVSQLDQFFLFCRVNDTTFTVHEQVLLEDYHLATIAELIEAFPNPTVNDSLTVEPEPRKGMVDSWLAGKFTIANEEADPVKEERSVVWNHAVAIKVGGEQIAFNVCKDRIQMQLDNGKDRPEHVDVTHLIRAVLAKYDELKAL